jgi:hypothetical protein
MVPPSNGLVPNNKLVDKPVPMAPSSVGMVPLMLFDVRMSVPNNFNFPNSVGIVLLKLQVAMVNVAKLDKFPIVVGIVPPKLGFAAKNKLVISANPPIAKGNVPWMPLFMTLKL